MIVKELKAIVENYITDRLDVMIFNILTQKLDIRINRIDDQIRFIVTFADHPIIDDRVDIK